MCPLNPVGGFEELLGSVPIVLRTKLQERLRLKRFYSDTGNCDFIGPFEEYEKHIKHCKCRYGGIDHESERSKLKRKRKGIAGRKKAPESEKLRLKECEDWYIRRRLETVIEATNAKIKKYKYDSTDVKYFLLIDELKTQERLAEAREINRIWREFCCTSLMLTNVSH